MIFGLVPGCSPTHMFIANWMWPWSNISFIFARDASVRRLQFSESAYHWYPEAEPDIYRKWAASYNAFLLLFHASKLQPQKTSLALNSIAFIESISGNKYWTKSDAQDMHKCSCSISAELVNTLIYQNLSDIWWLKWIEKQCYWVLTSLFTIKVGKDKKWDFLHVLLSKTWHILIFPTHF